MYVIPQPGRRVPDPEKGGYLPEVGRKVEPDVYWLRRVQDGDVKELSEQEGADLLAKEEKRLADKKGSK
jgi:hypothetical protein